MVEKLFEEGKIGKVTIKNRIVMPAMGTGYASSTGEASDGIIRFYQERAKGGCGLIITEIVRIDDESGVGMSCQLSATKASQIQRLSYLADAVHQYDTKIFAQLHHPGRQTPSRLLNGHPILAPSPIPCGVIREMPKELTVEEIKNLVRKFVNGAYIVKTAGFDGVELHAAHGYLISQFLSPYTNQRTDQYGGDFSNRVRFLTEIILGIRDTLGEDFPISVRINGKDFLDGGLELEDQVQLAKYLESIGVAALNVSCGMYESGWSIIEPSAIPEGWKKDLAKTIKANVKIPVIAVNNIKHPEVAEQLLEEGVSDFVGIARCQLTDPQFANKAKAHDTESIRKCIGCLYCFKTVNQGRQVACTVNPVLGREFMFNEDTLKKNGEGKKVAVIGGGPAGMQASIVLAKRKYKPVIFEKQNVLGGTLNIGDKPPFKTMMTEFCQTLIREVKDLDIEVRLGTTADVEMLKGEGYYGIVVATGGKPFAPPIQGLDKENVHFFHEILSGKIQLSGKKVVVLGGGETGLETAEFLADRGNQVRVVEMLNQVGQEMYSAVLGLMMKRFAEKGIEVITQHKVVEVQDHKIIVRHVVTERDEALEADILVVASGVRPDQDGIARFKAASDHVILVGDANRPGNIAKAMKEANDQCYVF